MKNILKPNKVPYPIPVPNNMGMVRYILALAVVIAHYNILTGGNIYFPFSSYVAVGGFFSLSGFLIYGSYLKKENFRTYILSRMIRLLPAYFFIVLACAFGLFFVSGETVQSYFANSEFWKYLGANLTFMNFLQPTLPGVFESMEISTVNGSLWTLKVEWMLYLSVPLVALLVKKIHGRATLTFILIYAVSVAYRLLFRYLYAASGSEIYNILGRQMFGQLTFFYCGVMIYYWYDVFMRYRWQLMTGALLLMLIPTDQYNLDILVDPVAFSILVTGVSMTGRWATWEGRRDNVSYNMYLVHFPICQLAAYYNLKSYSGEWGAFLIVLTVTVLLSVFINRCIEKPIQKAVKRH